MSPSQQPLTLDTNCAEYGQLEVDPQQEPPCHGQRSWHWGRLGVAASAASAVMVGATALSHSKGNGAGVALGSGLQRGMRGMTGDSLQMWGASLSDVQNASNRSQHAAQHVSHQVSNQVNNASGQVSNAVVSQGGERVGAIHWTSHLEYCIEVAPHEAKPTNGAKVQIWTCEASGTTDPARKFRMPESGHGQIRWDSHPEYCLHVAGGNGLQSNPNAVAAVNIWKCDDESEAPSMQFNVPTEGAGKFSWASNPALCLDIVSGMMTNGADVQVVNCDYQEHTPNKDFTMPVPTHVGVIHWTYHPEFCIDVAPHEAEKTNGAKVHIWTCEASGTEDPENKFRMPESGHGQIVWDSHPEYCLHVAGGNGLQSNPNAVAAVNIWKCDDESEAPSMHFKVPTAGKGKIAWASNPALCLDIVNGIMKNGADVQVVNCDYEDDLRFSYM